MGLQLVVLADQNGSSEDLSLPNAKIARCWRYNSAFNLFRIFRQIRRFRPDVVWFNLGLATMAHDPITAPANLIMPAVFRMFGYFTHVTLHTIVDFSEPKDAGVRFPRLTRLACEVLTYAILRANRVSVLLPAYAHVLRQKYGASNVSVVPHGLFSVPTEVPVKERKPIICALGKWGTYKRVDFLVDGFRKVRSRLNSAELWIGGADHPLAIGYLAEMKTKYRNEPGVRFLGYVPETELADVLPECAVMALPYRSSGGCSGVAHLASQYGLPIVAPDIADFRDMVSSLPSPIIFFAPNDPVGLANALLGVLDNPATVKHHVNVTTVHAPSMTEVVETYIRLFESCLGGQPASAARAA